ncbi:MAG: tyrosine--tRNA ligase [Pseudomonadales bacterium]|nr:tyrosine--tRNA ligase [Pseudomonadales bacterium]
MSDHAGLAEHLGGRSRSVYSGFDPTAPSLQVGNLVPLLMLRRLQPSHRRARWCDRRHRRSVRADRGADAELRRDHRGLGGIDRSPGGGDRRHRWFECRDRGEQPGLDPRRRRDQLPAGCGQTLLRERDDSARFRPERDGSGISYTEFSYALLQAFDFLQLARRYDCDVQVGGSDQWGNIVAGIDLVRRVLRRPAYALSMPLVTKRDGSKFGKSAAGAVWLDAERTSPYAFYQFWLNSADADVGSFLRCFTLLEEDAINAAQASLEAHPERREAQRLLAVEATRLVHGDAGVSSAERITATLFDGDIRSLGADDMAQLERDGMERTEVAPGTGLLTALTAAGLANSNGAARRLVQGKGIRLNGAGVTDPTMRLDTADALQGRFHLLRRGRKNWHLLVLAET